MIGQLRDDRKQDGGGGAAKGHRLDSNPVPRPSHLMSHGASYTILKLKHIVNSKFVSIDANDLFKVGSSCENQSNINPVKGPVLRK